MRCKHFDKRRNSSFIIYFKLIHGKGKENQKYKPVLKIFCTNFPRMTFFKIVKVILIRCKTWHPGAAACFPYKCIHSENLFSKDVPWVTLYQDCSKYSDRLKNMASGDGAWFPCMNIYIENFKKLLVKNIGLILK